MGKIVTLVGGPQDGGTAEVPWTQYEVEVDGAVYRPVTILDHLAKVWRLWTVH